MDKYIINGVEIEYDTFDLVNMEVYDSEVKRVAAEAERLRGVELNRDNYLGILRGQCESIMDAFDCIVGEGTARMLFGTRVNVADILNAYGEFTGAVAARLGNLSGGQTAPAPAGNREQRRAAEREQRRAEAAERVRRKDHADAV